VANKKKRDSVYGIYRKIKLGIERSIKDSLILKLKFRANIKNAIMNKNKFKILIPSGDRPVNLHTKEKVG
jgi:hypothetical protein